MMLFFLACSQNDPKYFNSNPQITITSHEDQGTVHAGYEIVFLAQASDPNNTVEDLQVQWKLNENVLCPWTNPDEIGQSICSTTLPDGTFTITAFAKDIYDFLDESSIQISTVEGGGPSVFFIEPSENEFFYEDQRIPFTVQYYDPEDIPSDLDVVWSSDIDGTFEVDGEVTTDGFFRGSSKLSKGLHTIEIQVTDADGNMASTQQNIIVGPPNSPPICEILSPSNNQAFGEEEEILFTAFIEDNDVDVTSLYVQWISDKDGIVAEFIPQGNEVDTSTSTLSHDLHLMTLLVEDEQGLLCSDSVLLSISTPPSITIQQPQVGDVVTLGEAIELSVS